MITSAKVISLGFLGLGVFVLMQVILPLFSFQILEISQKFSNQILISPNSSQDKNILGISVEKGNNFPAFISNLKRESVPNYTEFSVTVPSIKLNDVTVYVDSNDLSKGSVHLPGTALPGEKGNVFISGHSSLDRIFNSGAVFSKLPDVKKGDQIEVLANGTKFEYKVTEIKIVNPTDLSVIAPPDSRGRFITLMTCVPPGLNLKRLIVLGKMI